MKLPSKADQISNGSKPWSNDRPKLLQTSDERLAQTWYTAGQVVHSLPFEDLLGKPYRADARGPEAYDCAGLAVEMQRRRGFVLPIPATPDGRVHQAGVMRRILRAHWRPIEQPQPGCLVFWPGQAHVATMLDERRFLHTTSENGEAGVESLRDPLWRRRRRLFYLPIAGVQLVRPARAEGVVDLTHVPPRLTLCRNPFDLTIDHQAIPLGRKTVGVALRRAGVDVAGRSYVISCNGELLPPERAMQYRPRNGDDIQVVPKIQNSTLRTIALVGVSIAAAAFAGPLGAVLAGALGTSAAVGTAVAGALISIGGGLLVNGIASLFGPGAGGQSYGVLGPSTTARSGIPIPKGNGTMRAAGNIVESWIDIQGDNGDVHDVDDGADRIGRQYINCRVDFGRGPARALRNLLLNGKDITSFADVAYCLLLGTNDQAPVTLNDPRWVILNKTVIGTTLNTHPTTGFDTVNNNYPSNQRIRAGVATNFVILPGQRDDTQKLTVYVTWPGGLWRYDDSMVIKRLASSYDVYYRLAGSGDAGWVHVPGSGTPSGESHYYYNIRQTVLRQATIIDGLSPARYDVKVVNNGTGAVFNPLDHFEHESNKFGEQLWLESVQETSYTTLSYPNSIQVCLRIMATDQISGSDLNLQADITYGIRSTLPAALSTLAEDNPAAVAYDICSDSVIGMGLPDSRIDLDWLADLGALCDSLVDNGDGGTQKLARFNGIFDQPNVSCWQALSTVCFIGRSAPQRIGRRITGWIDQADIPVQIFHAGNILLNSYKKTWLPLEDRSTEIDVNFADASDNYKQRNPVRVLTSATETTEEAITKRSITMLGCTDRVQAYYRAVLMLRENENLLRKHKWQSNRNAIRCRTGNVVLLSQDIPTNAWGGLVEPGSTASVLWMERLDLLFDASSNHSAVVQLPTLHVCTCTVTAVAGGAVYLAGYDGVSEVARLVFTPAGGTATPATGPIDAAIVTMARAGSVWSATLEDTTGLTAGMSVDLWMTDPLESATVSAVAVLVNPVTGNLCSQITLATPLPAVPADYCGCIYQSTLRQAFKVRISEIAKKVNEQRYMLSAGDYSDDTYLLPAPVSGQSYTPPTVPAPVPPTSPAAGNMDANLSVAYIENQSDPSSRFDQPTSTYQVTGIAIQAPGSGYTGSSVFQLVSDYQAASGTTTDPAVTLTATLDLHGSITAIAGWTSATWNGQPYVLITR